eukprot:symbB.v1.2.020424.t1/scaffold1653.1/size107518/5
MKVKRVNLQLRRNVRGLPKRRCPRSNWSKLHAVSGTLAQVVFQTALWWPSPRGVLRMTRPFWVLLLVCLSVSAELQGEVDVATSGLFLTEVTPATPETPKTSGLKRSLLRGAQVVPSVGIMALGGYYLWQKGPRPHSIDPEVIQELGDSDKWASLKHQELPEHVPVWSKVERSETGPPRWPLYLACSATLAALLVRRRRRSKGVSSEMTVVPIFVKASGKPGDPKAYDGIIVRTEGTWSLNGRRGTYRFNRSTGWLETGEGEVLSRFQCQRIQERPLELPVNSYSKMGNLKILSSEIMTEIQKKENAGALFVLPAQLNGAEYPSHLHVVKHVEEYKSDNTGGPRGQLAVHPAVAQFLLDNAASTALEENTGINAIDEILKILPIGFDLVNGYLKIHDVDSKSESETLELLLKYLNNLRPLVMDDVPANGLTPDKKTFSSESHKVGLVYASAVPVDSYMNQGGKADFQARVGELILVGQYYGALKYAAESQKVSGLTGKRKVFLMPLGGGVFNNPWDIIAKSMAKAIQLLDDDLLSLLDISALAWNGNPSEEQKLKLILGKLTSHPPVSITLQPPVGKSQLFRIGTGQPDEEPEPAYWKRMMTDLSDVSDRPLDLAEQTEIFRMQTQDAAASGESPRPSPRLVMQKVDEENAGDDASPPAEAAKKAEEARKEKEAAEAAKKAEEAKREKETAEAAKKAEEARKEKEAADAARKAEEARKEKEAADAARKAEEARKAKEAADAARKAEEAKKEKEAAAAAKKAEEARKAEEAKKEKEAAEAAKKAEEARKAKEAADAARKAEEARRKAEEAKKAAEVAKEAEEARKAEEAKKVEEAAAAVQKADEARRKAKEAKRAAEAAKKADEIKKAVETKKAAKKRRKKKRRRRLNNSNFGHLAF